MWATIAAIGIYVWQRGVEQSVEDLGWLMGFLAGLEEEGEKIGNIKGSRIANDARRIPKKASRGRTRGAGWN